MSGAKRALDCAPASAAAELRDPRLAALRGTSLHHLAAVEQAVLEITRRRAQDPAEAQLVLRDLPTELGALLHRVGAA